MNCIVTAGPTFEPLDEVRRLTNFSTGRLGIELGNFLVRQGHGVRLLVGEHASHRGERLAGKVETFTTTDDLRRRLESLAETQVDAVFHAAAVSDFAFGKIWIRSPEGELTEVKGGKISTRQGTLLAELTPTTKIISSLRAWFPKARLVGWKYEVEGDPASVIAAGEKQLRECVTEACVVNGPAYGPGFGVVTRHEKTISIETDQALFAVLEKLMRE